MDDMTQPYVIVADVGGTYARFGRVALEHVTIDKIEIFSCADYSNFDSALTQYQRIHSLEHLNSVALAIACPVNGDWIQMTNCHWQFSVSDLKSRLKLAEFAVMNDFSAIAMSVPFLAPDQLVQIGQGNLIHHDVKVVLGAGTGLGVAYLIGNKAYACEGGHAGWSATTEREWFIYNHLKNQYGHVSQERILSGQGLENIYKALAVLNQKNVAPLSAAEISTAALTQQDDLAEQAVAQFFSSLGTYAGDLALILGAIGGVYLAGGIVPRLLPLLQKSNFRAQFENKGRFQGFNEQIPTYLITASQPGMLGAALTLRNIKT